MTPLITDALFRSHTKSTYLLKASAAEHEQKLCREALIDCMQLSETEHRSALFKEECLHAGLFVETVHPAFSTSDLDVKRRRHTTLKRLDFVRAYTEYYWSKANTIASMVCAPPAQHAVCLAPQPESCP